MTVEKTDPNMAALMAFNPGFTPTTSASGNLNLLQDIYGMAGDPMLAYQQGLVTPQFLLQMISDQTKSTVYSFDDTDFASIENRANAVEDEVLQSAFARIREGMSLGGVQRWLIEQWSEGGLTKQEESVIDSLLGPNGKLAEYEKRWLNASDADARERAGELTFNEKTGEYIGQMDDESARDVLKSFGFSGLLAQPAFWKSIPDDAYTQKALADEAAASAQYDVFQKLNESLLQRSTSAAQSVYDALRRPPSGPGSAQQSEYEKSIFAPTISSSAAANPPVPGSKYDAPQYQPDAPKPPQDNTTEGILSRLTDREREQWAKMGASYAGRGVQTEGQGQVSSAKAEVDKLIESSQENRRLAEENAFNPALALLAQAPLYAASLSTPAPKPVKAKPRTLSDQEIETMASMIAGGFAG